MASGNSLLQWGAANNEPPMSDYATLDTFNTTSPHLVLDFDTTTQEIAIFSGVMPQHYSDTTGVTVYLHWVTHTAVAGTVGWDVTFERNADGGDDINTDSWATAQTVTAETVPGTAGIVAVSSVACAKGATGMDSVVAGDRFRIRVRRDVANDDAAGDACLLAVEIRET